MDLILVREKKRPSGIFGKLCAPDGITFCLTLEHAYPTTEGYQPKLPAGTYRCVRGPHQLHTGPIFETFEITGVPGHTGILFHVGNWNRDSEGCVLVGYTISGDNALTRSRDTFKKFMELQAGLDEFQLTVLS